MSSCVALYRAPPTETGTECQQRHSCLSVEAHSDGASEVPDSVSSGEMVSGMERLVRAWILSNTLHDILDRITPQNYEEMKKELFDLPICQSTDKEISDVVDMIYMQAVQSESDMFIKLYVRLMADLVKHTGVQNVGKTIRKAIIGKCQDEFEQPFRLTDEERVDAEGNPLPVEEIVRKTMMLKEKLRANIKFLGHMFVNGIVNEKVVNYVLFHLRYGGEGEFPERQPEEYELEMFFDLLRIVVDQLSQKILTEYIAVYMDSLEKMIPKVSNRIKFMIKEMQELYKNNWEEDRRAAS